MVAISESCAFHFGAMHFGKCSVTLIPVLMWHGTLLEHSLKLIKLLFALFFLTAVTLQGRHAENILIAEL